MQCSKNSLGRETHARGRPVLKDGAKCVCFVEVTEKLASGCNIPWGGNEGASGEGDLI